MADENPQSSGMQIVGDINMRIKDLEEKQRMQKERLLLIGENLVEIKESVDEKILDIKKDIEMLKQNIERMTSFLESASREFSKFAKKEDLDILSKQAKMFQPLDFVRKKDLKKFQR
jgi:predicted  nucleic acid-binding Zn-ribbon protein